MKTESFSGELHPGITMHKIPVGAGFPGLVFTIGMLAVFLMGIPALIYFLLFAMVLGIGFAVMLRFIPRQAGFVAFVFTCVIVVSVAGIPSIDWPEKLPEHMLLSAIVAPPPPPEDYPSAYQCDCSQCQSKQSRDCTAQRGRRQQRPGPPSPFDGTWEGKMNDLPGVTLIVADAGGGQVGGVVTFYFQMRDDERSAWRVAGKHVAPLLSAHTEGKALVFEVQHHTRHGSPEFAANVKFRAELAGGNEALLYNMSEPAMGPSRLVRQE